jgi:hypothetical protein
VGVIIHGPDYGTFCWDSAVIDEALLEAANGRALQAEALAIDLEAPLKRDMMI